MPANLPYFVRTRMIEPLIEPLIFYCLQLGKTTCHSPQFFLKKIKRRVVLFA